jgi:hypothetical protein
MLTRVFAVGAGPIASAIDIEACGAGGTGAGAGAALRGGGIFGFAALAPRVGPSEIATGASGVPDPLWATVLLLVVGEDAIAAATESDSGNAMAARVESAATLERDSGRPMSPADAVRVDLDATALVASARSCSAVATRLTEISPMSAAAARPICFRENGNRRCGGISSSSPGAK